MRPPRPRPSVSLGYRLTRRAEADLTEIYGAGLSAFGVAAADSYLSGLLDTFDLILRNPELGRLRVEFSPPVRIHAHRAHIIIYIADNAGVLIVRIRHGREDWRSAREGA